MEQYIHIATCTYTHTCTCRISRLVRREHGWQAGQQSLGFEEESRGSHGWKAELSLRHVTFHTGSEAEKGLMARGDQRDGSLDKSRAQPGRKNQKKGGIIFKSSKLTE